jgi:hypothetical protein
MPLFKTAPDARNIGWLSKNAGRRITLSVRLNITTSYKSVMDLSLIRVIPLEEDFDGPISRRAFPV